MSKGYVYILSNPMMPGLVKIGKTTREVNARAVELYQTGVPAPFKVEHQVHTPDCDTLELKIHQVLSKYRVDPSREFFKCLVSVAKHELDELRSDQINDWVDYFVPEHTIVHVDEFIDPASIHVLANNSGRSFSEIAHALDYIRPEEIEPALARYERRERPVEIMKKAEVVK